ncbi:hypothetical protein CLFE_010970 [Clostridium felsineum DSM 794]|nr:hypothetical protein CLFE_010970 [Clostridium felsineum DSM 794]
MNALVIILTATIPIFNLSNSIITKYIASICGVLASIITAAITFYSYKLSWLKYREAAEYIKKEIRLASMGLEKYNNMDRENLVKALVQKIEEISENENSNFRKFLGEKEYDKQK